MGEQRESQLTDLVTSILSSLGTLDTNLANPKSSDSSLENSTESCLLVRLREREQRFNSGSPLAEQLSSLIRSGITLRRQWARPWYNAIDLWLGPRFYLSHARNLLPSRKLVSVVSSRLGRHGSKMRDWPRLLDAAMRSAETLGLCPLLVPETTLFEATREFSLAAGLDTILVDFNAQETDLRAWLKRQLQRVEAERGWLDRRLCVSPAWMAGPNSPPQVAGVPWQDRLSLALPDIAYVISRRRGGNTHRLVEARLRDDRFPVGSIFLNLHNKTSKTRTTDATCGLPIEQKAVGWYVAPTARHDNQHLVHCSWHGSRDRQTRDELGQPLQQLAAALPGCWSTEASSYPPVLVHCTRGTSGPGPDENDADYRRRLWMARRVPENHPLVTLCKICAEGILLGSSKITRTSQRCVSFSAVALPELLRRRQFNAHLGRWDWEPYGLLVARQALVQAGAKPVIYGNDADFHELCDQDQPFFQPWGTTKHRWSEEQEWRLLGDLRLNQLPRDGVRLFVRTRLEAQQVARRFPWPVFWAES